MSMSRTGEHYTYCEATTMEMRATSKCKREIRSGKKECGGDVISSRYEWVACGVGDRWMDRVERAQLNYIWRQKRIGGKR